MKVGVVKVLVLVVAAVTTAEDGASGSGLGSGTLS